MIKSRGTLSVHNKSADFRELIDSVGTLPDGEYDYLIYDRFKNHSLPQLKYLCGVVLKTISDNLPEHPPVAALYRWFEQAFAPIHTCTIDGQQYDYVDLKNERSSEMAYVIDRIIQHARLEWGISIPDRDILKAPEARSLYAEAYTETWRSILPNITPKQQ